MMLFWILAITDLIMVGITWAFMEVQQPIGTGCSLVSIFLNLLSPCLRWLS